MLYDLGARSEGFHCDSCDSTWRKTTLYFFFSIETLIIILIFVLAQLENGSSNPWGDQRLSTKFLNKEVLNLSVYSLCGYDELMSLRKFIYILTFMIRLRCIYFVEKGSSAVFPFKLEKKILPPRDKISRRIRLH